MLYIIIMYITGALIVYAVILYLKQKIRHHKNYPEKKESKEDDCKAQMNGGAGNDDLKRGEATVLLSCHTGQSAVTILSKNGQEDQTRLRHGKGKKEKVKSSESGKSYTTWNYQYAKVDRFFLFFSPFLFLIFNTIYWGYFLLGDTFFQYGTEE